MVEQLFCKQQVRGSSPRLGSMLKKIISSGTWIVFFSLCLVTVLVAIAQRSLPGQPTYPLKIGFEKALLGFYSLFDKQTGYQFVLTNNRYIEVRQVLTTHYAIESLDSLNAQVIQTKNTIESINNPATRARAATTYISQLDGVSTQLTTDKQIIQSVVQPVGPSVVPTPTIAVYPTNKPLIIITQNVTKEPLPSPIPSPTPAPAQTPVVTAINETQTTIQQTITDLSQFTNEKDRGKKNNNKRNDHPDKNNSKNKDN